MARRGRLIALEGGEGSGKSTQAVRLAERLGAVLTREPGGTEVGERIRDLLLHEAGHLDPRAEALLMAAARAQHVAEVIRPALEAGRDVVTDRYSGSSLAYQGFGRGLAVDDVRRLSDWATGGLWPDVVVVLDVAPEEAARRLTERGARPDRLEAEGAAFHRRVVEGFRRLAADHPGGWVLVDGAGPPDAVAERVAAAVASVLAGGPSSTTCAPAPPSTSPRCTPAWSASSRPLPSSWPPPPAPCTPTCWSDRRAAASGRRRGGSPPPCCAPISAAGAASPAVGCSGARTPT